MKLGGRYLVLGLALLASIGGCAHFAQRQPAIAAAAPCSPVPAAVTPSPIEAPWIVVRDLGHLGSAP